MNMSHAVLWKQQKIALWVWKTQTDSQPSWYCQATGRFRHIRRQRGILKLTRAQQQVHVPVSLVVRYNQPFSTQGVWRFGDHVNAAKQKGMTSTSPQHLKAHYLHTHCVWGTQKHRQTLAQCDNVNAGNQPLWQQRCKIMSNTLAGTRTQKGSFDNRKKGIQRVQHHLGTPVWMFLDVHPFRSPFCLASWSQLCRTETNWLRASNPNHRL